jgi:hypothetical protein
MKTQQKNIRYQPGIVKNAPSIKCQQVNNCEEKVKIFL